MTLHLSITHSDTSPESSNTHLLQRAACWCIELNPCTADRALCVALIGHCVRVDALGPRVPAETASSTTQAASISTEQA